MHRPFGSAIVLSLLTAGLSVAASEQPASAADMEACATNVAAATTPRLVPNAGFEDSAASPSEWDVSGLTTVGIASSPVFAGARSLRITDSATTGTTAHVSVRSDDFRVVPGEELTLVARAHRQSGNGGHLYVEFWNQAGERTGVEETPLPAGTGSWQTLSVKATAPADAVRAGALLHSASAEAGVVYWDEVSLTSAQPSIRKVYNAGFETQRTTPDAWPNDWETSAGAGLSQPNPYPVTSNVHNGPAGSRSLRIYDDSGNGSTGASVSVISRGVPVNQGETVTVTAWARFIDTLSSPYATGGYLYVEGYDNNVRELHCIVHVTSTSWAPYKGSITVSGGIDTLKVRLYSKAADQGITLWDDISLRSSLDAAEAYDPAIGSGSVLFVGDERIDTMSGITRAVQPGQHKTIVDGTGWGGNARAQGSVLQVPAVPGGPAAGYYLWYRDGAGPALAHSTNGTTWSYAGPLSTLANQVNDVSVVLNRARILDPTNTAKPLFLALGGGYGDPSLPKTEGYSIRAYSSNDGMNWSKYPNATSFTTFNRFDVARVTWDPATSRYIATVKQWKCNNAACDNGFDLTARTVGLSSSADFVNWSPLRLSFSADRTDIARSADFLTSTGRTGTKVPDPDTDMYAMPVSRYGEQYLGLPWVFDIQDTNQTMGQDVGPSHIELTSSLNTWGWSRPDRSHLVTKSAKGGWDYGFQTTADQLLTIRDRTYLYYGSFQGEHACSTLADSPACTAVQSPAHLGRVDWATDRFVALTGGSAGGTLVTRPLAPSATTRNLTVNTDGVLSVDVLDQNGLPIAGYTGGDVTAPADTDDSNNTHEVTWGANTTLPTGTIRLRFNLTSGAQLFAYSVGG
jgi:hypothetical protein